MCTIEKNMKTGKDEAETGQTILERVKK